MLPKDKLETACLRIMATNAMRLFGCLLYNFDISFIETDKLFNSEIPDTDRDIIRQRLTAYATIINNKPSIGIYSSFIDECEVEELTYVILHEIIHVLDKHYMAGELYPDGYLHNLAADHIINTNLNKDVRAGIFTNKVKTPEHAFIISDIEDNDDYNTIAEVYNWLVTNAQKNGGMKFGGGIEMYTLTINGKDQHVVTDIKPSEGDGDGEIDKDTLDAIGDSLQAEARTIMNNSGDLLSRGTGAGSSIGKLIEKIIEVKIPWTSLLDKSIAQKIVPDSANRSWKGLQKRPFALGMYYPTEDIQEKPCQLIIVEDQSASVVDEDVRKFASVLLHSIRYFDEVRIMRHDTKVHRDVTYEAAQTTEADLRFETIGRGGTSHTEVFDRIQKSHEHEDDISLVIMLTDFESNVERLWEDPKYSWTKDIPVSIVVNCNNSIPKEIDKNPIYINK